ncbi:MAG TPA: sulfite exporter TauE/SafE family protein [Candidatus Kapabacteria bacterium]|nr:sulfite exporter TauE/SafE family protein [Candidatus Kapabacteria bacterium]
MNVIEILQIGGALVLGGFIQSSSGFGFGLFIIPVLLFFGFSLAPTVIIVVIGSAIQKVTALPYLKQHLDWKEMMPFILIGLLGLPLGIYAMFKISNMDQPIVKQVIGGLVMVMLVLQWKGAIKIREHVPKFWGYTAGLLAGILNGFANIGGPPLVLWTLAHRWSNQKMRGTIIAFSLIFVPFQLVLMLITFGSVMFSPLLKAMVLSPAVLLGTWIGLKIGEKISQDHLRIYMQALLLFIAVASVFKL